MKAQITIRLKRDVLDPEGKAIEMALNNLGFSGIKNLRKGKVIDIVLQEQDDVKAHAQLTEMCERLLCNRVIEDYQIERLSPD